MTRLVLLAVACLLAAGCAQKPQPEYTIDFSGYVDEDRPDPSFGDVDAGPAAGPDLNATTAAAPKLVRGEWWRIRFESSFFEERPELVRVVADVNEDGYLIGMPHEGWFKEALAYHVPAFGDVGFDLSYELHNERFEPLRFPLETGATWTTLFATSEFTATVEEADEFTATIRYDPVPADPQPTDPAYAALNPFGDVGSLRLVFDAREHEVVRFESFIGNWEVVEHGYDYDGWVTVPRGLHTEIDYGQFLPITPGEPVITRTKLIEGGYNRLTLLHGIFALGPGSYSVRTTAPNGTEFLTEYTGGEGITFSFYEAAEPDGEWTMEDIVAGPGGTFSMGMAYHQYDIRLPDGARRSDHAHPVIR